MPPGTRPDEHEGRSYVGLVPFRMVGVSLGRGPGIPYLGSFLETNVRLYSVDDTGRRGVVFLSLDTDRAAAVPAAPGDRRRAVPLGADAVPRATGDVVTYDARLRRLGRPAGSPGRGPGRGRRARPRPLDTS